MSRFDQEWALVPTGARWTAVLVTLVFTALMGAIFLLPGARGSQHEGLPRPLADLPVALVGARSVGVFVLLLGYVWGDARRRGMNHVMWTLLALFIPYAVGLILYFILRDPVPVPCPSCAAPARKGHAFCASCGAAVRAACPQCRQPVEGAWRNCASCGQSLQAAGAAAG